MPTRQSARLHRIFNFDLFAAQDAQAGTMTQPQFTEFVSAEIDKWGKVIQSANVKLE